MPSGKPKSKIRNHNPGKSREKPTLKEMNELIDRQKQLSQNLAQMTH